MPEITEMQDCGICNESKPVTEFAKDRRRDNGRIGTCKTCRRKQERDRRQLHGYACNHPLDSLLRLEGGFYTWCEKCGALKRNKEKVWTKPEGLKL
jgi:hypothetical protein